VAHQRLIQVVRLQVPQLRRRMVLREDEAAKRIHPRMAADDDCLKRATTSGLDSLSAGRGWKMFMLTAGVFNVIPYGFHQEGTCDLKSERGSKAYLRGTWRLWKMLFQMKPSERPGNGDCSGTKILAPSEVWRAARPCPGYERRDRRRRRGSWSIWLAASSLTPAIASPDHKSSIVEDDSSEILPTPRRVHRSSGR
jgi:hypothetical protein